ncbi:hypothetical protein EVJ58_g5057 [Rhodofomes roseus]|uniref:Uncharacterized protein n=1 Tax=Rhodofomes roseus TaxID=34475 RepID=A0A4Y9YFE3_9APHY|nr:hypothetical protein EVJ58_g5057 [Rhodofomes roseus]
MFVNLTYLVIRIVIRRDTFIRMAREWRTFCKEIDGLCSARPLINFEFRLDLRISMHPIVPITQLPEDLRAMMETIAALFVEATSGLASCLPPPERTGGRVRFGIIWLWGGNLPFATAFDKQHCPREYFLGDPEWYRSNEAPWDFRRA